MKKMILIADSHLTDEGPDWKMFLQLLEWVSSSAFDVLFLGDIFDLWIACPGYETSRHQHFLDWCRREKKKRNVWFLEGNHEFFLKQNREDAFTEVSAEGLLLDGGHLYAVHGDTVNLKDKAYRFLRTIVRNRFSYVLIRLFGMTGAGGFLSRKIRRDLRGTNLEQKRYFPEAELRELSEHVLRHGGKCAAVGHFHRTSCVGNLTVLPRWCFPDYQVGVYQSGEICVLPMGELTGEKK